MRKIITAVVVLVVVIVGILLLRGSTPAVAPSNEAAAPNTFGTETNTPAASKTIIAYTDSGYAPATLEAQKGATVTFKNESSRQMWPASAMHPTHTVYDGTSLSEHCPNTSNTAFDACEGIAPGQSWSFTFDKAGTWRYHDHLQVNNTGTIEVTE